MISRKPDFVIGDPNAPYLRRWWLTNRKRDMEKCKIYLHHILRDDDDRAFHDHPSRSCSIILRGGYVEHLPNGVKKNRYAGHVIFRKAEQPHRLELHRDKNGQPIPAWTIFIFGPKIREWGFLCPNGWRHWREFTGVPEGQEAKGDERGRGCE